MKVTIDKMGFMGDFTLFELMVVAGIIIILALILSEVFDVTHFFSQYAKKDCVYGYGPINGPHVWKIKFPASQGKLQSPININSNGTICVPAETIPLLGFSPEYYKVAKDMKIYNDGHTASIYATWDNNLRPKLCGGPLCDGYNFFTLIFRWGPCDAEGSEHMIDSYRYAMEVQAIHIKANAKFNSLSKAAAARALLIVSYLYQITACPNPYLQPVIESLKKIRCPFSTVAMEPTPLSWIMPPFTRRYYAYCGSLTHPPCTQGVRWIVQPEPLSISSRQLRQFRKLMAVDRSSIEINSRPVQSLNNRDVFYYD